ncbi:MAG TPA: hypothetical protein VHD31_03335 [Candidatus Paceibacterota bacterium]|nr:hypothetical protein [Candidatus Paceibacterota bacterium]
MNLEQQILVLQQTIETLQKANEVLTQQWTPINTILAAIAVLFTVITILWGIVFAFGFIAYRQLGKQKNQMVKDAQKLRDDGREVIKYIEDEGKNLLEQIKGKKGTIEHAQAELKNFEEKAKRAIERLEDKTFVTVSGANSSVFSGGFGGSVTSSFVSPPGNLNAKVCSKCGALYSDRASNGGIYFPQIFSPGVIGRTSLCERCRKEAGGVGQVGI